MLKTRAGTEAGVKENPLSHMGIEETSHCEETKLDAIGGEGTAATGS